MTEPEHFSQAREDFGPSELERALPAAPIDASVRMRVQRAARSAYEGTSERASFVWHEALVPVTLLLAGVFYGVGAFQKLVEIFS